MTRRLLPFLALLALVMGAWLGAPQPSQAQTSAQDVCLARWVWNTDDDRNAYWEAPHQANLTGLIDLRSESQAGSPGPTAQGWGLFAFDSPMGSTGMHCMGGDLDASITPVQANTIAVILGKTAGSIQARDMRTLVKEILTTDADPSGQNFAKPARISRDEGFKVHLGGYGTIVNDRFSRTHPAFQPTLEVRKEDYRRAKAAGVPLETLQKWTGYDALQYYGSRNPTSDILDALLPTEHRSDGSRKPETTIIDSFTDTDGTSIDIHTPTPTNWGSWAETHGDYWEVRNNHLYAQTSGGTAVLRAEADLSSDDHYAQMELITASWSGGSEGGFTSGPLVRKRTDNAHIAYGVMFDYINAQLSIVKYDNFGGATVLMSTAHTPTAGEVLRIEVDNSDIVAKVNGSQVGTTVSDTAITGHLRNGVRGDMTFWTRTNEWDNFEAADLSVAPPARRFIVINSIGQFLVSQTWLHQNWAGLSPAGWVR